MKVKLEDFRKLGFVSREEAAQICGRAVCGDFTKLLEDSGVQRVTVSQRPGKGAVYLWLMDDLEKIPKAKTMNKVDVSDLMEKLDKLSSRVKDLED